MSKSYYTLLVDYDGEWIPEFGDYSRAVVAQEKADSYADEKTKIIKTGESQLDINIRISELNAAN